MKKLKNGWMSLNQNPVAASVGRTTPESFASTQERVRGSNFFPSWQTQREASKIGKK
jgi:hypothetical protein